MWIRACVTALEARLLLSARATAPEGTYYAACSDEDAAFYFTDGLMRRSTPVVEAVVADEVAHKVLGHVGTRRKLCFGARRSLATPLDVLADSRACWPPIPPSTPGWPRSSLSRRRPRGRRARCPG